MQDSSASPLEPVGSTLGLSCLSHLEQEEALLGATLESLRKVRAALVEGNLAALTQALEQQEHTSRAGQELKSCRARLRRQWARALRLPESSVTLRVLADALPGEEGKRIGQLREKLQRATAEVERLNRANAALVRHSLNFLHLLYVAITGGKQTGRCYDASGKARETISGSLIEARG